MSRTLRWEMSYLLLHAGRAGRPGPRDRRAVTPLRSQPPLVLWEGRAHVEHGGEECSLTLRVEADRSTGCPKVRSVLTGGTLGSRGLPVLTLSRPLALFLRTPFPALHSTRAHHSASVKDGMEELVTRQKGLSSEVQDITEDTMGFCPKSPRVFLLRICN